MKPRSPSSEKNLETVSFEKFGVTFTLNIVRDIRREWRAVVTLPSGEVLDTSKQDWVSKIPAGVRPDTAWEETEDRIVTTYVQHVAVQDDEFCVAPKSLQVYTTGDGPLLAIQLELDEDTITLLDPCVVKYDDRKNGLQLLPIFNVARHVRIMKSAVRMIAPPSEILAAIYPGFMIQNRQAKYQLKTRDALTEVLVTEGMGTPVTA